jgi:hypothetical protein
MDPDRPNFGTTVIDVDMDMGAELPDNDEFPTWLRDMIGGALTATGLRPKRTAASDEALESLVNVDVSTLDDINCPICYEPYEVVSPKTDSSKPGEETVRRYNDQDYNEIVAEDVNLVRNLAARGVSVQSLQHRSTFEDPALFFPTDDGCVNYSRFPTRNLSSLELVTLQDQFPNYEDDDTIKRKKQEKHARLQVQGHIAVKIPKCGHVFGKSCVVEWFKNNVSCPLCREEVEASKEDDPLYKRTQTVTNSVNCHYNRNDDMINHILHHSTDIFNPYRRPFNPAITPLTDSYMSQDWATPYSESMTRIGSRDPNLVLPRRFPFPEPRVLAFPLSRNLFFPRRNQRNTSDEENRRDNNGNNNGERTENDNENENENENGTNEGNTQDGSIVITESNVRNETSQPNVGFNMSTNSSENDDTDSSTTNSSFGTNHHNSSFFHPRQGDELNDSRASSPQRTGGPERSRRIGRVHPYGRPDEA